MAESRHRRVAGLFLAHFDFRLPLIRRHALRCGSGRRTGTTHARPARPPLVSNFVAVRSRAGLDREYHPLLQSPRSGGLGGVRGAGADSLEDVSPFRLGMGLCRVVPGLCLDRLPRGDHPAIVVAVGESDCVRRNPAPALVADPHPLPDQSDLLIFIEPPLFACYGVSSLSPFNSIVRKHHHADFQSKPFNVGNSKSLDFPGKSRDSSRDDIVLGIHRQRLSRVDLGLRIDRQKTVVGNNDFYTSA